MLEGYDSSIDHHSTLFIKISIAELMEAIEEMNVHSVFNVVKHLLIDTGEPKPICSEPWLKDSNWTPVRKIPLPNNMHPFRFAGHPVHAMYAACLVSLVHDIRDLMLRLKCLHNMAEFTAFKAYLSRWIAYFDELVYNAVDRGSWFRNQSVQPTHG